MKIHRFVVADLPFECIFPKDIEVEKVLPSFLPFMQEKSSGDSCFVFETVQDLEPMNEAVLLEEFQNDMGKVRLFRNENAFQVELNYDNSTVNKYCLWMNHEVSYARAVVDWDLPEVIVALTSMLRIVFSQRILVYQGFSIHASTVVKDGEGFMFLGKSGTGKSTHSRLWQRVWREVELLNDDNPIVRIVGGRLWVYGSPWSGKTPCYVQKRVPLKGIVRLKQALENRWTSLKGVKAWAAIYPSCAVIREEIGLYGKLCNTLNNVVEQVKVGTLNCLPNMDAARMSEENLK